MDTSAAVTPPIGGVVFDLDGTLVDSSSDIARAANHCLRRAGLPERSEREIRGFIGDGSRVLLARAADLPPDARELDALLESFVEFYGEHAVDSSRLLPGVHEVLDALRHLPRAVCTNKPRATTGAVLGGLGIEHAFDVVVAAGDAPFIKPHPAPLELVGRRLGVPCQRLVLVGDGPQDVACAKAAGARSIGISDAVIVPLERLLAAGPDALVPLREVPRVIANWQRPQADSAMSAR